MTMLTATSTSAHPISNAYDRTNADPSASAAASARAKFSLNEASSTTGADPTRASDAARAAPVAKAGAIDTSIPDPVRMLALLGSTSSANNTSGTTPTTLAMMSDIAVASGSGTLSDAQRQQLQTQYAQLQVQLATAVNGMSESQAQAFADHQRDSDAGDNAQSGADRRSTLTRDNQAQAPQTVQHEPQEQLVTTTKMVQVRDDSAPQKAPVTTVRVHELHVGSDSYEPVAVKQTQTHTTRPAEFARVEQQSTTHRVAVAQVTQIRQLSQVAQVQQLSVVA